VHNFKGILGYNFTVLSASHSVVDVRTAILKYVGNLMQYFSHDLSEEDLETHRRSLISKRSLPFTSLAEAASENWSSIESRRYDFDSREVDVAMLRSGYEDVAGTKVVDRSRMIALVDEYFLREQNIRMMIIEVDLPSNTEEKVKNTSAFDYVVDLQAPLEVRSQLLQAFEAYPSQI
jgi:secreted Zn-dependent insulinase-like peptidase